MQIKRKKNAKKGELGQKMQMQGLFWDFSCIFFPPMGYGQCVCVKIFHFFLAHVNFFL